MIFIIFIQLIYHIQRNLKRQRAQKTRGEGPSMIMYEKMGPRSYFSFSYRDQWRKTNWKPLKYYTYYICYLYTCSWILIIIRYFINWLLIRRRIKNIYPLRDVTLLFFYNIYYIVTLYRFNYIIFTYKK